MTTTTDSTTTRTRTHRLLRGEAEKDKTSSINWPFLEKGDLYERENEHYRLLQSFQRQISSNSTQELVLISGKSGVGKTALANTLHQSVANRGGFFISGKLTFDHVEYPEPYAPFLAALTDFTKCVIEKGAPDLEASIKDAIAQEVDVSESHVLFDLFPTPIKEFVGFDTVSCIQQHGMSAAKDVHRRLRILLCSFIRAISSHEHPLVLLIDDLQWADSETLSLLCELASAQDIDGLMLLCTCRDNEVDFEDAAAIMLRKLDQLGVIITEIQLSNISERAVNNVIADTLELDLSTSKPLAEVLYIRTKGNMFFVLELLRSLHEEGTIYMDANESRWRWDENQMSILEFCDNVQNWLSKKMARLPPEVQEVLKVASCIGSEFDQCSLSDLLPTVYVDEVLAIVTRKGFVASRKRIQGTYKFTHDRFHQAAYGLIPDDEQNAFHLSLGRKLLKLFKENKNDTNIFLLVNQLSRGVSLISDQEEKDEIAGLFLEAGKQAMKASDFSMGAAYFQQGMDLIRINNPTSSREAVREWRHRYDLSLELHNMAAEAEYVKGNLVMTSKIINEVLINARSFQDKLRAYITEVYSLGTRHELGDAIRKGLDVLKLLGETFPSNEPSTVQVVMELVKAKRILYKKSDSDLISLPHMMDHTKVAAMSLLNVLATYSQLGNSKYTPLFCCRMVQLSMRFGLCPVSSFGFAGYGVICCTLKDFAGAYRYGQVALSILDKFKIAEWAPRTTALVYGYLNHWTVPLRHCLPGLKNATRLGLQTGDIEFAMIAANFYARKLTLTGEPLKKVEKEICSLRQLMRDHKQETWHVLISIVLQYIYNLMGKSDNPLYFTGPALDEEAVLATTAQASDANILFNRNIYLDRLVLAYTFNDYGLAYEMAVKSTDAQNSAASFRSVLMLLYEGITALALNRDRCKRSYIKKAKRCLKALKRHSNRATANCLNKVLLMEAELAASQGNLSLAMSKYKACIAAAEAEDFLHEQALALECAGQTLKHFSRDSDSLEYLTKAFHCYKRWGARAKTQQMLNRYPGLHGVINSPIFLQ